MKGKLHFACAVGVILASGAAAARAQAPRAVAAASGIASPTRAEPFSENRSAAPAPASAASGAVSTPAAGDYVLTSADTIEMIIFREPDMTTRQKIASDGTVQLPLIRDVRIGGLTVRAARELIRKLYDADYLVDPQVQLNLVDFAQRKFTIIGQVNKPGIYEMPGGRALSLLEAVAMSGDFTRSADKGKVIVKRTTEGGAEGTIKVNAKKKAGDSSGGINILTGDVIIVGESWW